MSKQKILINHWRWLEAQGKSYKQQAASCKQQAASLTAGLGYDRINLERRTYGTIYNSTYRLRWSG